MKFCNAWEKYCLIPYTAVVAEAYHILILYCIPLIGIGATYTRITIFMRRASQTSTLVLAAIQRQRNHTDLTVMKRIIMLVSVLVVLRFPTIVIMTHGSIVGHMYPLAHKIVGIITSMCLIFIGISTIYTTPQLRKQMLNPVCNRNNQVRPQ
ncbi:unnamed protein product [Rotaria socialis]|uniref:G-protein coupled receptors family 1 profile domain-containing protein n=1 Tax=Rotaria socialis TaxID=392032 RepID=A0A821FC98_9BILA|nr:unnamed protein product [Rotaria socialis]